MSVYKVEGYIQIPESYFRPIKMMSPGGKGDLLGALIDFYEGTRTKDTVPRLWSDSLETLYQSLCEPVEPLCEPTREPKKAPDKTEQGLFLSNRYFGEITKLDNEEIGKLVRDLYEYVMGAPRPDASDLSPRASVLFGIISEDQRA